MGITITKKVNESRIDGTFERGESKIFCQAVPQKKRDFLRKKHIRVKKGTEHGWDEYIKDVLKCSIVGWEGLTDDDGQDYTFDKSRVVEMFGGMAGALPSELVEFVLDLEPAEQEETSVPKSSKTGS